MMERRSNRADRLLRWSPLHLSSAVQFDTYPDDTAAVVVAAVHRHAIAVVLAAVVDMKDQDENDL